MLWRVCLMKIGKIILCFMLLGVLFASSASGKETEAAFKPSKRCSLAPKDGSCKALFEKFYYDADSKKCDAFFYGGCDGVVPFETIEECQAACENPDDLHVARTSNGALPQYGIFDVEYPKNWDKPKLSIQLNGTEGEYQALGGGFDTNKQVATYMIALGDAGKKEIKVVGKTKDQALEAKTSFYWNAPSMSELLDRAGNDDALLSKEELRFFMLQIKDYKFLLNGNKIDSVSTVSESPKGVIVALRPEWATGTNTMTFEATDNSGASIAKTYSFVYLPGGEITQGDAALLTYGSPGSKSGPFYSVRCEDDTIKLSNESEFPVHSLDGNGWVRFDYKLAVKIEAVKQGAASLRIYKKEHFTLGEELFQTVALKVVPKFGQ